MKKQAKSQSTGFKTKKFNIPATFAERMTKEQIIEYWVNSADRDWKAAQDLASSGNLVQSLFFAHLVVEKLLKAHWVKDNDGDFPPRTHNL